MIYENQESRNGESMVDVVQRLVRETTELKNDVQTLHADNKLIKADNDKLKADNDKLKAQVRWSKNVLLCHIVFDDHSGLNVIEKLVSMKQCPTTWGNVTHKGVTGIKNMDLNPASFLNARF